MNGPFLVQHIPLSTGVTLEYVERGAPSECPLVLLHGVTDSWRSFEGVLAQLPPSLHAIALTQRGHGGSSKPAAGYRYHDFAEDLRAFLDARGIARAVVVGHSMGGLVAQRFAASHPHRVAGLVLMGTFATIHGRADLAEFAAFVATLRDPIERAVAHDFQTSTLARAIPEEQLATFVSESLSAPAHVWREAFAGFVATADFSHELARSAAPALIVWGDRDSYALRADQDALRAALPEARLVVYAGHGHAFHWEDPARFARDLLAFVTERCLASAPSPARARPDSPNNCNRKGGLS
jgi:pimeloyl-ACP methyl ester carboxylesterase